MLADFSWANGSIESAVEMLSKRAMISKEIGGFVKLSKVPPAAKPEYVLVPSAKDPLNTEPSKLVSTETLAGGGNTAPTDIPFWNTYAGSGLRGGLIGAGIGGVLGVGSSMLEPDKKRKPGRNAMTGALIGGLAGGGIGVLNNYMNPSSTAGGDKSHPDAGKTPAESGISKAEGDRLVAMRVAAKTPNPNLPGALGGAISYARSFPNALEEFTNGGEAGWHEGFRHLDFPGWHRLADPDAQLGPFKGGIFPSGMSTGRSYADLLTGTAALDFGLSNFVTPSSHFADPMRFRYGLKHPDAANLVGGADRLKDVSEFVAGMPYTEITNHIRYGLDKHGNPIIDPETRKPIDPGTLIKLNNVSGDVLHRLQTQDLPHGTPRNIDPDFNLYKQNLEAKITALKPKALNYADYTAAGGAATTSDYAKHLGLSNEYGKLNDWEHKLRTAPDPVVAAAHTNITDDKIKAFLHDYARHHKAVGGGHSLHDLEQLQRHTADPDTFKTFMNSSAPDAKAGLPLPEYKILEQHFNAPPTSRTTSVPAAPDFGTINSRTFPLNTAKAFGQPDVSNAERFLHNYANNAGKYEGAEGAALKHLSTLANTRSGTAAKSELEEALHRATTPVGTTPEMLGYSHKAWELKPETTGKMISNYGQEEWQKSPGQAGKFFRSRFGGGSEPPPTPVQPQYYKDVFSGGKAKPVYPAGYMPGWRDTAREAFGALQRTGRRGVGHLTRVNRATAYLASMAVAEFIDRMHPPDPNVIGARTPEYMRYIDHAANQYMPEISKSIGSENVRSTTRLTPIEKIKLTQIYHDNNLTPESKAEAYKQLFQKSIKANPE